MVISFLARRGIPESEISQRFEEVEKALVQLFGAGGKIMLVDALTSLCEEYSLHLDLLYGNTLSNRLDQLKDRILVDKLTPKHYRKTIDTISFEDKTGTTAGWSG